MYAKWTRTAACKPEIGCFRRCPVTLSRPSVPCQSQSAPPLLPFLASFTNRAHSYGKPKLRAQRENSLNFLTLRHSSSKVKREREKGREKEREVAKAAERAGQKTALTFSKVRVGSNPASVNYKSSSFPTLFSNSWQVLIPCSCCKWLVWFSCTYLLILFTLLSILLSEIISCFLILRKINIFHCFSTLF